MGLIPTLTGRVESVAPVPGGGYYKAKLVLVAAARTYPHRTFDTPQTVLDPRPVEDLPPYAAVGKRLHVLAFPLAGADTWEAESYYQPFDGRF